MEKKVFFSLNHISGEESREYMLKISSDSWEINILLSKVELLEIPNVINAHWNDRKSLKLGDCLGSPTWWSLDNKNLSIVVGADDEVWDFGITMSEACLEDLFSEIDVGEIRSG